MANLEVINQDGKLLVDSREVAEMVGKRHDHLVRDIDGYIKVLDQSPNLGFDNFFVESQYQSGTGKSYKCFLLTRKGCDMVANKMTGEKGVLFTATYVTKFEEMEKQLSNPLENYLQMSEEDRAIAYFNERKAKKQLEEQLKLSKPKLQKYDQFLDADGLMNGNQVAKILGIGRNKLYAFLRENKIYMKGNTPYQKYMNRGLFKMKGKVTRVGVKNVTLITPKGADFIADLLEDKQQVS